MRPSEWVEIVQVIEANWPHVEVPDDSLAKWYDDLRALDAQHVRMAVEAFYREGREFPPNGGLILAKVSEFERGDIDHGAAWRLVNDALLRYVPYEWEKFYRYLEEHSPAVAEAARRFCFENQNGYLTENEPTVRAQFREIYKAVVRERKHDAAYGSMGAMDPRQLRGTGPKQIGEVLAKAIGEGS